MIQTATASVRPRRDPEPAAGSATFYAVRELAWRAGVSPELFRTWRIDSEEPGFTSMFVQPGTKRRIRFPRVRFQPMKEIRTSVVRTATAAWMRLPGKRLDGIVPDFKVPFAFTDREHVGSLFTVVSSDCIECSVDLLTSTLLTLSRFEETLPLPRDQHDRFPAFASVAWRDGFLHRPIVDEYGLALEQALSCLLPTWEPVKRRLRVKLGHDVDEIGIPFSFRSAVAHTFRRGRPLATLRDLLAPCTGIDTTYQRSLRRLVALSLEKGIDSAVYWKASTPSPHDTGYDPHHPRILSLVTEFRSLGIEMGIHPGYQTFESPGRFSAEVLKLQQLLGERQLGGRQDFLRWSPQSWTQWEALGLAYDASVGFADQIGFRAGTCHPYRPWLLSENREAELLEIPLLAMDSTLQGYMKLTPEQALSALRDCVTRCRTVGGVFTLLWHNTRLVPPGYAAIYERLLDELAGSDRYDWKSSCNEIC